MAAPTNAQVGQKVTVIADQSLTVAAAKVTNTQANEPVKYVPESGKADYD